MKELVEQFRSDVEPWQERHVGHDFVATDEYVLFDGGWEASQEAWLFKQWLEENGHTVAYADEYKKGLAIVDEVDVPDWVNVTKIDGSSVRVEAMDEFAILSRDELDAEIERFRDALWERIKSVSGVGTQSIERLKDEFVTPMHGLGRFDEVDGIGSETAATLDSFVGQKL